MEVTPKINMLTFKIPNIVTPILLRNISTFT
jgi:hypothetical protein